MNEDFKDEITINVPEFLSVIEQLEEVPFKIDNSEIQLELEELKNTSQELLEIYKENNVIYTPEELEAIEVQELEEQLKEEELKQLDLEQTENIQNSIIELNENVITLSSTIEQIDNNVNEMDSLQIQANGANIMLLYIVILYLLFKFIYGIFSFFTNKI